MSEPFPPQVGVASGLGPELAQTIRQACDDASLSATERIEVYRLLSAQWTAIADELTQRWERQGDSPGTT